MVTDLSPFVLDCLGFRTQSLLPEEPPLPRRTGALPSPATWERDQASLHAPVAPLGMDLTGGLKRDTSCAAEPPGSCLPELLAPGSLVLLQVTRRRPPWEAGAGWQGCDQVGVWDPFVRAQSPTPACL